MLERLTALTGALIGRDAGRGNCHRGRVDSRVCRRIMNLMGGEVPVQLNKILLASDGSKESRGALTWAEMLAIRFRAKITAISIVESPDVGSFEFSEKLRKEISLMDRESVRKEAERLPRVAATLKQKGIEAKTRVATGVPYEEIIKAAQTEGVDLIAMGKRGLSLWAKMLLGSTTTRVLRESRLPLLTVREWTKKPTVKSIVVPSSFAPADIVPLEWALDLAGTLGASVYLLHITEAHPSWDTPEGKFMARRRKLYTDKLDEMLATVPTRRRKGVPVFTRVKAFLRPWSGILSFVDEEGIDMVVMGTHARKGVPRLFLGSVAERVIGEAPCPVITVRP
jgi:nucleotide-binding universal stress UspA family protein